MGGAGTEVTSETRRVIPESAIFHGPTIRNTARRLACARSEHAPREGDRPGLPRYAPTVRGTADGGDHGARVASGIVDNDPEPAPARVIEVELARLERLLGILVAAEEVVALLRPLGFEVAWTGRWRRRCRIIGLTWWPGRTWPRKGPRARL